MTFRNVQICITREIDKIIGCQKCTYLLRIQKSTGVMHRFKLGIYI